MLTEFWMKKLMSAEAQACEDTLASDTFINSYKFYTVMDMVSARVNQILGVYPDNLERRVSIAIIVAVIGAIFVLLALVYTFSLFRTDIYFAAGGIKETAYASQNLGYFLMVMYALFIGSVLYYIFLPWKSKQRKY